MLPKGMGESFLLPKDEPLTPNIDGVIEFLEEGPKRPKIGKKWQKLDLSILVFIFCPRPLEEIRSNLRILKLPKRPR